MDFDRNKPRMKLCKLHFEYLNETLTVKEVSFTKETNPTFLKYWNLLCALWVTFLVFYLFYELICGSL